jgi:predicted dehydrogenase
MWTRFFPAVEQARRLVHGTHEESGMIGDVVQVYSDFNFNASDSEEYPSSFVYNHALGGGATLLVAPYPVSTSMLFFSQNTPDQIKVVGQVDQYTGVDLQATAVLNFPPSSNSTPNHPLKHEFHSPKLPG